jgi:hypothetical protein
MLSSFSKPDSIPMTDSEPLLKIGLVADPQYADKPNNGDRFYKESLWKLEEAVGVFNSSGVDIVQTLGDVIDADWASFDSILPIYQNINSEIENFQLLGNHEFAIDPLHYDSLLERLFMPNYYYSYTREGWRFIVLDATDYSYFSNPLHNHDINLVDAYYQYTSGSPNHQLWNSAIGKEQQNWLIQELDSASILNQKVILFSHGPLKAMDPTDNLWNDFEIINILENYSNVVAHFNGHNHQGDYIFENGIHYITMTAMVSTMINSYAILEIYEDRVVIKGYGDQQSILIEN